VIPSFPGQLAAELEALRGRHRLRTCPSLAGASRVEVTLDGVPLVSFCSNDYLGMATNPALLSAAAAAFTRSGFGASGSRLVCGTFPEHLALEAALAALVGAEAALLFPTGYQANLGTLAALAGPGDLIVADRSVHASLIDGCRLSRAKLSIYPHRDLSRAEKHLRRLGGAARRRLLVTESLFSMDGDVAPLGDLAALAEANDALLLVDEAHAIGCLGPRGAGLCAHFGIRPDVLVGTLGKALGASGAFVAGSAALRAYLLNHARSFLFTTALPPPLAAAASASLDIVSSAAGDSLRRSLLAAAASLRSALALAPDPSASPIIPFILGDDAAALHASSHLRDRGFLVQPIRPPTVREGAARLRLTVSAKHTPEQVARLAASLAELSLPASTASPSLPIRSSSVPAGPSTPPPLPGVFLLGTDTAVGKTTVGVALLHLLAARGLRPVPFKPVETGLGQHPSDASRLRDAAMRADLPIDVVCPFRFPAPLAPAAAAQASGTGLDLQALLSAAAAAGSFGAPLIVESAGGLLTPYADNLTSADLASALGLPVLLVARNALGTVNHTALSVLEIRRRALSLLGIILVHTDPSVTPDQPSNASLIARLTGIPPLGVLPHLPSPTPSLLAAALEQAVDLRPLLPLLQPPAPQPPRAV